MYDNRGRVRYVHKPSCRRDQVDVWRTWRLLPSMSDCSPETCRTPHLKHFLQTGAVLYGWYGHLMALYKTKFNWVTWSPPKYILPIIFSWYPALRIFWNTKWQIKFLNRFFNLTGSLGYHKNLTRCWHHGTRHTCKVSKSAIHHAPSNMATCLRTHRLTNSHTIKPPTAGVRQVGHTSKGKGMFYLYCTVSSPLDGLKAL